MRNDKSGKNVHNMIGCDEKRVILLHDLQSKTGLNIFCSNGRKTNPWDKNDPGWFWPLLGGMNLQTASNGLTRAGSSEIELWLLSMNLKLIYCKLFDNDVLYIPNYWHYEMRARLSQIEHYLIQQRYSINV